MLMYIFRNLSSVALPLTTYFSKHQVDQHVGLIVSHSSQKQPNIIIGGLPTVYLSRDMFAHVFEKKNQKREDNTLARGMCRKTTVKEAREVSENILCALRHI